MHHDATPTRSEQSHPLASQVRQHLLSFLAPLLRTLDHQLDRRLVVTFVETLQASTGVTFWIEVDKTASISMIRVPR
jgi:hypothetical protein